MCCIISLLPHVYITEILSIQNGSHCIYKHVFLHVIPVIVYSYQVHDICTFNTTRKRIVNILTSISVVVTTRKKLFFHYISTNMFQIVKYKFFFFKLLFT